MCWTLRWDYCCTFARKLLSSQLLVEFCLVTLNNECANDYSSKFSYVSTWWLDANFSKRYSAAFRTAGTVTICLTTEIALTWHQIISWIIRAKANFLGQRLLILNYFKFPWIYQHKKQNAQYLNLLVVEKILWVQALLAIRCRAALLIADAGLVVGAENARPADDERVKLYHRAAAWLFAWEDSIVRCRVPGFQHNFPNESIVNSPRNHHTAASCRANIFWHSRSSSTLRSTSANSRRLWCTLPGILWSPRSQKCLCSFEDTNLLFGLPWLTKIGWSTVENWTK